MTAFSIAGLSSGIDTTSVISQLMTLAAGPQTALKTQLSTVQSKLSAYQSINSVVAAAQTAAAALANADTWKATTTASSDSSIVASSTTSAVPGSATTFDVVRLAAAQISTIDASGSVVASPPDGIDVVDGAGNSHHISITDGTASAVASAINAAKLGVRASVVNTDAGQKLQFTATTSGAAGSFQINGLTSTPTNLATAQDAQIRVGDPAAGGYTVSSSSNTFSNAIVGVTFSVSKLTTGVTLSTSSDASSISDATKAMVTAVNTALSTIKQATAQGAILNSDNTLNQLAQKMLGLVSSGTSAGGTYSTAGISLDSNGQLTFDPTKFASAYAADPAGTTSMVQTSLAGTMSTLTDGATNTTSGSLAALITSDNGQVTTLNKQISDWDTRLADQKQSLESRYAAMESALSKLKSQSTYLTSVFAAMTPSSSTSSA
jgi:flagellar hook-associated protein 2